MTRETIKEYILQVKSQDGTEALYNRWEPDILVEVINEIFNDHEAQLKKYIELGEKQALEFDRFFDAFGLKSENISIDDAINFFKAKDKEIERLKAEVQYYIELEAGEDL